MNVKENKSALKKAKECFSQKNYKETIKICKKILREDPDNYGALVIIAACFQEVEDLKIRALEYLKRATNLQPENPVAWKGLVCYYEKEIDNPDIWIELISAYCNVIQFESDTTKFEHNINSCADLILRLNDDKVFEETVTVLSKVKKLCTEKDSNKLMPLNKALLMLLTRYPRISGNYDDLLENLLSSVLNNTTVANHQDYFRRYLKLLYKLKKYELQLQEAIKMQDLYPNNSYPLEWICRTYSELVIIHNRSKDLQVTEYYEKLFKLNQMSSFGLLAKALDLYTQKSYVASRDILNYLTSVRNLLAAWILLIKVNMKLYSWELAENAAVEAEQIISTMADTFLQKKVRFYLIECMMRSNKKAKWETVVHNYIKFLDKTSPTHLLLLGRIYVLMENPKASTILDQLEKHKHLKTDATILKAMQLANESRLEEAINELENALDTSEAWVLMGKIYLKMGEHGHSHMAFLKGIQMDSNNWECLVYLGHYYKENGNNLDRSRKCYEKALQINPNSDDAGINLSIVYRMLKDDEANLQLLEQMTADGKGPKWAWLQLGLLKLERGDPQESIKCLRNVIRFDPNDSTTWETLADAYFARGAFTSAMKSYQKAIELRPESFYSLMQVAHIKLLLSQYEEAKIEYEKVIQQKEDNVVALKGLAETHMGLARNYIMSQRLERASNHIQIAVDYLVNIVTKRSEFSCIWKLLGNACYLIAKLPDKYCSLLISPGLIKSNNRIGDAQVEIQKRDILTLAVRSYCRALNLTRDSSLIWHDLAISYLTQLQIDPSIDKNEAIIRCLSAIKHAIRLCPTSWYHWNLLGVICMNDNIKNYALAQHSFASAIEIEHNNSVSWTNLGTLYLTLGDFYKANEAFSWAQRSDPAYVNSWVGQAIIAEQMGSSEAMDLFRHTTQINYHPQGALGYAHWVIQTLLDQKIKNNPYYTYSIVNMYAVSVATDCITWYTNHHSNDVYALNTYGLLLERQKMYKSAAEKFSQALDYAQDNSERDFISINLARVSVQLGEFDKAVKLCETIKNASFKSHCQLAIALFKAERYEESYSTYETILEWLADTDSQKGHILCAMAAMAYMFDSIDAVKTLLFQCIDIKPRIVSGLLATAALGTLHDDYNLAALILKELEAFRDDEDYRHHIALLSASLALKLKGPEAATKSLVKIIRRHPGDARLWTHLVKFLFKSESEYTLTCAFKALFLGRDTNELNLSKIASITSFSELKSNPSTGIKSVLKMVHAFPGCIDNWATLIAALLSKYNSKDSIPNAYWISALTSIVRKELPCSQEMVQWLLNNEQYAAQMLNNMTVKPV